MITRRSLMIGTAAVAGSVALGGNAHAAATCGPDLELRGNAKRAITVRSRSGWGANESYRFNGSTEIWPPAYFKVQAITVHHAGYDDGNDPVATVRNIYYNDAVTAKYGDIGYHLLIDWNGVVYEGRYSGADCTPVFDVTNAVNAAHVIRYNAANVGICMLRNLSVLQPTAAAISALTNTVAVLSLISGLDPRGTVNYVNPISGDAKTVPVFSGHHDWASTECPGANLYPKLPQIRLDAWNLMQ
jgi:N-acetylmuramoyl-L-alanine amidase-like protein